MAKIQLKVIENLDGLKRVFNGIDNLNATLFTIGTLSKEELSKNWLDGKAGNGRAWQGRGLNHNANELSPGYKEFKAKAGRDPVPNMNFNGQMVRGLTPKRIAKNSVALKFIGGKNKEKASNNHNLRPNMFVLATKFKNRMVKIVRKHIFPF